MCQKANQVIRNAAKDAGVLHWEIAERLGMQDSAFSRMLRRELPSNEQDRILLAISELRAEKAG